MQKGRVGPELIRDLLREGLSDQSIADRVGWTVGTLRVRCSQWKISLKRPRHGKKQHRLTGNVMLPHGVLDQMSQRARSMGVTTAELAAELLREIARDNLYEIVLAKAVISHGCLATADAHLRPAVA
ncbi:MAG TPA: hypothetical protein VFB29_06275 [Pseudolabrys sp.]|nr:hypothetical protein [Pseudolabrys sp.]